MRGGVGIKKVVIAGGGTAGWMAAAAFSKLLPHHLDVVLVESDSIGTVGVGEATIPTMQSFHLLLQIDEREFIRETQATFKLGIQFKNWGEIGDSYLHSFGDTGRECWAGQFQHFWMRGRREGLEFPYGDFSFEHQAALAKKFAHTKNPRMNYAYHLDATLYAKFLRKFSEKNGVKRIEGKINHVELNPQNGFIQSLNLESGEKVSGDLFIDCTGFAGLLTEGALKTGYENWSDMLFCDSAVAVQTQAVEAPIPYTKSIAYDAGWQWRIPLQHRVGNGLVYASEHMEHDTAESVLRDNIEGELINEPRRIRFQPGRRKKIWNKNCVAMGLSSGFIEPLESTSIHLISSSIIRLLKFIPLAGIREVDVDEFNKQAVDELQSIRDFIILHYNATKREDSEFWRRCKALTIPSSLNTRMEIYKDSARIFWSQEELFTVNSWNQVMLGQGLTPQAYHPVADEMSSEELKRFLLGLRKSVSDMVGALPRHSSFVASISRGEQA